MTTAPSSTLANPPFSSPLAPAPHKPHAPPHHLSFTTRATTEDDSSPEPPTDDFEARLAQLRVRNRSGTGKKAEVRKSRKSNKKAGPSGVSVFLPPVPLKEPVSGGLKVEFGFTPYSERINGRVAMLGLSALVLVELATGKSVISYHSPSIVFVQVYFVAAICAMYSKVQKERLSVWPQ
ncbi:hypothetical protein RJ640_013273 [Escallonia rubra]|uniref:Uncharacterized protein n=1 Tax=Escallonia rubra TaxID=112253 RepID=A0AA88QY50_9ASTE|nr:hypothetical protein RJ640_013273 [Escallonia rubra]